MLRRSRQTHSERLAERLKVSKVVGAEVVPLVTENLDLLGQTLDFPAENGSSSREAGGRIRPLFAGSHQVDTVPFFVEDDRVDVDLPSARVHQLEAHRRAAAREGVPPFGDNVLQRGNV